MYLLLLQADQKAKARPRRPTSACSSARTVPDCERIWTDIEPGTQSNLAFPVAKKIEYSSSSWSISSRRRWCAWVLEITRLSSERIWALLILAWWIVEGPNARRLRQQEKFFFFFKYCTDSSGQEGLFLRAVQGHSGRNPIDPTLQYTVLTPNNFFEYIYHVGCAISLHSITNSALIPGGQISSRERQTVFFTAVNPMDKEHKDPYRLDLTKPRLARYKQKKFKRHQDTVYWVDTQLAQRKGLKFYQTRCNAMILYDTLPACCISKVVVMESGEIIYEKIYASPRPPPTISFKDNWMKELDSEVAGSSKDTQRIQPKPKSQ